MGLRFVVGFIVLIIIAPALIQAFFEIQEAFASTEVFTWFTAAVIALLIIAAIVVAILGAD